MPRDHGHHSHHKGHGHGHDDHRPQILFQGTRKDDVIEANDASNLIFGHNGDDTIRSGAGFDRVDGGRGTDTSVYSGAISDYEITTFGRHWWKTTVVTGPEGTDILTRVEALRFEADDYTLWLDGTNNAVLAGDDTGATDEDTPLVLDAATLLANDREFDGDAISIAAVDATSAMGATVSFDGSTVTYDPSIFAALVAGEAVQDSFTYTVDDGKGGTDTATVTITVTGVNDAPEVTASSVTVDENTTAVAAGVSASDAEGDALTYALSGADAALFTIDAATGEIAFLAAPDFEAPLDADGDNAYELTVEASDGTDTGTTDITVTVADVAEAPPARINEFHYDNEGGDVGEFIEVRVPAGGDVSAMSVELYNGSNGAPYASLTLTGSVMTSDGTWDYHVINLPANGIQNGAPDGMALIDGGSVIEAFAYEGSLTGVGGTADGVTFEDIGVAEAGDTPVGFSLQRNDDGTWRAPEANTAGLDNNFEPPVELRINELHYDNAGTDEGEFIEVRVTAGADASGYFIDLVNGSNGTVYNTLALTDASVTSDGTWDYYVISLPSNGLQNGSPDGLALYDAGGVVEFLSYEGEMTAAAGAAAGMTSTDIGVSEPGDTPIGFSLQRADDGSWYAPGANTSGGANTPPAPAFEARINEVHYDNDGADTGEFIEIRVTAGTDPAGLSVELYNGSNGTTYDVIQLATEASVTSDGTWDYYVIDLPANGIQNGAPDGLALVSSGAVLEFLSYEGTMTATAGNALGLTSTDIGVSEPGDTPVGFSLQRNDDGTWRAPEANTSGAANDGAAGVAARINELHYDNAGSDVGEFIEVRVTAGADPSGYTVELYNGGTNAPYDTLSLATDASVTSDGTWDYYVVDLPANGLQNGSPDGLALVSGTEVVEFLSYEGTINATGGSATGLTSTDIGIAEGNDTPVGHSLQRSDDGATWVAAANTSGAENDDGVVVVPTLLLISEIQGAGAASPYDGVAGITVEAVVTYTTATGFYLTEEYADHDGNLASSEGIFVFTGGGYAVNVGDLVQVTATVDEFFDLTELTAVTDVTVVSSGNEMPVAHVTLGPDAANDWEAYEGMYLSVTSDTTDPLTITANFNLDRFGQISISAGTPVQPTQLFDAGSPEAAAAAAGNANNSLLLDDGSSAQNPGTYAYLPNTSPGDNGNGILDAGDDFSQGGTARLGTAITAPVTGALTFSFDEFQLVVDGTLALDDSTNPRPETPDDVGGTLQVASVNVLNYFTTFSGTTGPDNVGVRGADDATEFARQTEGLTAEILGTGAEVVALQELENNGFTAGSAVVTLTDELDAASGGTTDYVAVNPYDFTGAPLPAGDPGWIGSDAITTGIIYDANAVTLVHAEVIAFDEASNAVTNGIAAELGGYIGFSWDSFDRNRPSMAATFTDNASGEEFTVVSSHFKSKGDSDLQDIADAAESWLSGNPGHADATAVADLLAELRADPNFDQGDGQGFWNAVRTDAAVELHDWISTSYNGTGTDTVIYLGDMNAYTEEDPVQYLDDTAGLVDLVDAFIGQETAYSYVFDGQAGTLDQALADDAMAAFVTGVTEWHINADEPDLLNYDTGFNNPAFDAPGPFAASDHDPVIVGLDFGATLTV